MRTCSLLPIHFSITFKVHKLTAEQRTTEDTASHCMKARTRIESTLLVSNAPFIARLLKVNAKPALQKDIEIHNSHQYNVSM